MSLNKSKGNMYPWCDYTWNPIRGKCPHECSYCYMKRFPLGSLHLDEKSLRDDLSKAKTIFVGSSTDMWHFDVPSSWLIHVLDKCWEYSEVTFFFQSKNPTRFQYMPLPPNSIIGITLETNRSTENISKAPNPIERASLMYYEKRGTGRAMISMEPIMDFDLKEIIEWFGMWIKPEFVSIGADSKGHNLPEPPAEKIKELIQELEKFTEVRIKNNLKRLIALA
ncbi:MAG: phage Gp37/Gp68 family protein [Gammaproteobacteria bacterium]|nr:phage Gp37/Gp68 family protein [Gammaproteobacteria bacterium]